MSNRRRGRKSAVEPLPPAAIDWLLGGNGVVDGKVDIEFRFFAGLEERRTLWAEHGPAIVADHIRRHPGTRPRRWWDFDAPERRRRMGGTGTPAAEVLAHVPTFEFGIPTRWITDAQIEFFSGRVKDKAGRPVFVPSKPFEGLALDPEDPPRFESQAAYLDRLGLLAPGERRRLVPADLEPELVTFED